jgi:hypothetical protein
MEAGSPLVQDWKGRKGFQKGPTEYGRTSVREAFAEAFAPLIAQQGKNLGSAVVEAKRALASSHPEARDIQVGWTILGDPALTIQP